MEITITLSTFLGSLFAAAIIAFCVGFVICAILSNGKMADLETTNLFLRARLEKLESENEKQETQSLNKSVPQNSNLAGWPGVGYHEGEDTDPDP